MGCTKVDNFIEMHDKPQTFLTVVDKKTVHSLVLYGVAICVRSFELLYTLKICLKKTVTCLLVCTVSYGYCVMLISSFVTTMLLKKYTLLM